MHGGVPSKSELLHLAQQAPEVRVCLRVPEESRARFALRVVRTLKEAGYRAVWAGGCVRDLLLGSRPVDYDVATSARPEEVRRLFKRTVAVGAQFGVILVVGTREEGEIEVATFRVEGPYSDGRHPDRVEFASMEEDAKRRDFTINGMFYDPLDHVLFDYVGGLRDLANGVVRAIGNPRERFDEDRLRLLRAVRFAASFEFELDQDTLQAVKEMAAGIRSVSPERIQRELKLLLVHRRRAYGVRLMRDVGLLEHILPELTVGEAGRVPDALHKEGTDRFAHTLDVLERLDASWTRARTAACRHRGCEPDYSDQVPFELAYAALLHAYVPPVVEGPVPFEAILRRKRARPVRESCRKLRLSNAEMDVIEWLLDNRAALLHFSRLKPAQWKPLMAERSFPLLLALAYADSEALRTGLDEVQRCAELYVSLTPGQVNPAPLLTGRDLLGLAVPRGPAIGEILHAVRAAQLNGEIRDRDEALRLAVRLAEKYRSDPA